MNVKRFRRLCNISSFVLKGFTLFALLLTGYFMVQILTGNSNVWFNYEPPSFSIFTSASSMNLFNISDSEYRLAALIMTPFLITVYSYIMWKGAQLFKRLADGETPFNSQFAKTLKLLSIVLIISDIAFPILYSIILTTIYEDGHYFTIGLSSSFLIGIILYVIAEIFYYGIELQHLADETV